MSTKSKSFALVIVVLFLIPVVTLQQTAVAQPSNQPPKIEFQKTYGDNRTAAMSNIFQTIDGGFIFMDWGRSHYMIAESAIVYKIDSSVNMQWNRTFPQFQPSTVIQTNDGGYELFGDSSGTPTLIKLNSQGNTQWINNDSNLQRQIGGAYFQIRNPDLSDGSIKTSDGGNAKWTLGSITKTDSQGNIEWIENFTNPSLDNNGISPLSFFSLIETSDGAIAALGVGYYLSDSLFTGTIYLIKTEPFLPVPSPTKLQAPLLAPYALEMAVLVVSILTIIAIGSLLLFRRHRRTISQNKPNV